MEIVRIQGGFQTRTDNVPVAYRGGDVTLDHIIGVLTSGESVHCLDFRQATLVDSAREAAINEFSLFSFVALSKWAWRRELFKDKSIGIPLSPSV